MAVQITLTNAANNVGLTSIGKFAAGTNLFADSLLSAAIKIGLDRSAGPGEFTSQVSVGAFDVKLTVLRTTAITGYITAFDFIKDGEFLLRGIGNPHFTAATIATDLSPSSLFAQSNNLTGNAFANRFFSGDSADRINGGAGIDTMAYSETVGISSILRFGININVNSDSLQNVERLQFADRTVAFDIEGAPGLAYRLYQAAFNRKPDVGGLGFQINELDRGVTLKQLAQNFLNSPEFSSTYGNLDNSAYITKLYQNVLHRAPDAGGLAYHMNDLGTGAADRAQPAGEFLRIRRKPGRGHRHHPVRGLLHSCLTRSVVEALLSAAFPERGHGLLHRFVRVGIGNHDVGRDPVAMDACSAR